jgi:hypothetical protein
MWWQLASRRLGQRLRLLSLAREDSPNGRQPSDDPDDLQLTLKLP